MACEVLLLLSSPYTPHDIYVHLHLTTTERKFPWRSQDVESPMIMNEDSVEGPSWNPASFGSKTNQAL